MIQVPDPPCSTSCTRVDASVYMWFAMQQSTSLDGEQRNDHPDITAERDTPIRGTVGRPGSRTSWRSPPSSTVILQVLSAVLLVLFGLLLGGTWTMQVSQRKLGHQAEERRRLNKEWLAVRAIRRQQGECARCGNLLSARDW